MDQLKLQPQTFKTLSERFLYLHLSPHFLSSKSVALADQGSLRFQVLALFGIDCL